MPPTAQAAAAADASVQRFSANPVLPTTTATAPIPAADQPTAFQPPCKAAALTPPSKRTDPIVRRLLSARGCRADVKPC